MNDRLHWTTVEDAMAEAGVYSFGGREVLTLKNEKARAKVGADRVVTLPARLLPSVIAVGLYLEIIRIYAARRSGLMSHPINVLAWYRPGALDSAELGFNGDYNRAAGGTGDAHPNGGAADIRSAIGRHGDLRAAHVDAWRDVGDATALGRYLWGREHAEVRHRGGKLARQWRSLPLSYALTGGELADRKTEQVLTPFDAEQVIERLAERLRELRGAA
jgi:hypothetical protein